MKILDFIDNKVTISPEILSISPFKEIWVNDKSKEKELAIKQLKYIWFFSDYNSPYFKFPEEDRKKLILEDVLKDKSFKVDKDLVASIDKYKSLTYSPAIEAVESAFSLISKLNKYFKEIDFTEVSDPKKITDMFANMPKIIASLNEARKHAESENSAKIKVRGNASTGIFED